MKISYRPEIDGLRAIAVGAVMGVGLARGIGALDLRVIGGIMMSWVITLPVGTILSIFFFFCFRGIFL